MIFQLWTCDCKRIKNNMFSDLLKTRICHKHQHLSKVMRIAAQRMLNLRGDIKLCKNTASNAHLNNWNTTQFRVARPRLRLDCSSAAVILGTVFMMSPLLSVPQSFRLQLGCRPSILLQSQHFFHCILVGGTRSSNTFSFTIFLLGVQATLLPSPYSCWEFETDLSLTSCGTYSSFQDVRHWRSTNHPKYSCPYTFEEIM